MQSFLVNIASVSIIALGLTNSDVNLKRMHHLFNVIIWTYGHLTMWIFGSVLIWQYDLLTMQLFDHMIFSQWDYLSLWSFYMNIDCKYDRLTMLLCDPYLICRFTVRLFHHVNVWQCVCLAIWPFDNAYFWLYDRLPIWLFDYMIWQCDFLTICSLKLK